MKTFLVAAVSLSPFAQANQCILPPKPNTCDFYISCLENSKNCGPDGYAQSYGNFYCKRFNALDSNDLTSQGIRWRNATLMCLQRMLVPIVTGEENKTCEQIIDFAFDSHPACYTIPGDSICDLPVSDIYTAFDTVKLVDSIFSSRGLKQFYAVAKKCASDIFPFSEGPVYFSMPAQSEHIERNLAWQNIIAELEITLDIN